MNCVPGTIGKNALSILVGCEKLLRSNRCCVALRTAAPGTRFALPFASATGSATADIAAIAAALDPQVMHVLLDVVARASTHRLHLAHEPLIALAELGLVLGPDHVL